MDLDKLTPENVNAQFCSDWLKGEIRNLFAKLASAEAVQKELLDALADLRKEHAQYREAMEYLRDRFNAQLQLKNDMFWESELRTNRNYIEKALSSQDPKPQRPPMPTERAAMPYAEHHSDSCLTHHHMSVDGPHNPGKVQCVVSSDECPDCAILKIAKFGGPCARHSSDDPELAELEKLDWKPTSDTCIDCGEEIFNKVLGGRCVGCDHKARTSKTYSAKGEENGKD